MSSNVISLAQKDINFQSRKGKIVGSVFKACTLKYNHIGILKNYCMRVCKLVLLLNEYGDPSTLFKNLSFYNINPFANEARDRGH